MRARDERGAAAVEFAILVPALLLMIGLVLAGGRLAYARVVVQQLADSSARAASIARDAGAAAADAREVARSDASASGLSCVGGPDVRVDTSGFATVVGQAAEVTASVGCTVGLGDLLVPGLPGSVLVKADATSALDRYRGRR